MGTTLSIIRPSIATIFAGCFLSMQAAMACPCAEIKIPATPATDLTASAGLSYMKTDEYKKEFEKAISDAKAACNKHAGEKNLAIVSDIDETCLDNSKYFADHKTAGWNDWNSWVNEASDPPLKPTAEFLDWARKKGFAIFFITGRAENERKDTIENLVKAGISYDGLYMRPSGDDSRAEVMKTKFRKEIADMGFKTIVSIGDQYSDLAGDYAEDCEKLPNKIYFIP